MSLLKKFLLLFVFTIFIGMFFQACIHTGDQPTSDSANAAIDETITLHIVTEIINNGELTLNDLLSIVAETYERDHQNVDIQIELLSDKADEREIQMKRIRSEILAGNGPDLFLLPGGQTYVSLEPLFSDVELAMRNEAFYDISAFYDADDTMGKEQLNQRIMEAGVLEGARYLLPLYYDIPVVLMNPEKAGISGIDTERLKANVFDTIDALLETEDPMWCAGAYMGMTNNFFCHDVFPDLLDYSSGEVILTTGEAAAYMERVQKLHSYIGQLPPEKNYSFFDSTMLAYVGRGSNWYNSGFPIHIMNLNYAFEYAAIAKSNNWPLEIFPLRATDGSVIANVTYWGAVGAGSKHPDVAYDFLRLFLQEDVQWERIRKQVVKGSIEVIPWGMVTTGWPVRTGDSVEYIWRKYNKSINNYSDSGNEDKSWIERIQKLKDIAMWDEDFQILNTQIDEVRFSNKYEKDLSSALVSLNDGANGFAPKDVDIDKLAEDAIWDLKYHLGEG